MTRRRGVTLLLLMGLVGANALGAAAPASAANAKFVCAFVGAASITPGLTATPQAEATAVIGTIACAHKPAAPPVMKGFFQFYYHSTAESCAGGTSDGLYYLTMYSLDGGAGVGVGGGAFRVTRSGSQLTWQFLGDQLQGTVNGLQIPLLANLCQGGSTAGAEIVAAGALKDTFAGGA